MPCGEQEFRGNNRLRALEKTDFAEQLLLHKLYLQLNQILQVVPSLAVVFISLIQTMSQTFRHRGCDTLA